MRQEKNFALQIVLQSQSTWLLFFFSIWIYRQNIHYFKKSPFFRCFLCDYTAIVEHLVAKRI
jgi:hypothetical protein